MGENKFKAYLKERQPFGDTLDKPFVYDMVNDPDLPDPDPDSWEVLETYIKQHSPDDSGEALKAAEHIWGLYVKECGDA